MRELKNYDDVILFCKAMSSPIRASIVEILTQHTQMNIQDLAKELNVTSGALTSHIRLLSEAGIIQIENTNGTKGLQKLCSLRDQGFLLHLATPPKSMDSLEIDIPIGSFSAYEAHPTCGLATKEHLIGYFDNPIFFDDPERIYARIIWFYTGFLEYTIPNYLDTNQRLTEIRISQELCSEAPKTCENWPSDIYFSINGITVGTWTSPGDFGQHRGIYTPSWWHDALNQYGLRKTLSITSKGSFIDDQKVSNLTLRDLNLKNGTPIKYRISVPESAANVGGLTIFGRNFGNYNQNIQVTYVYELLDRESRT